MRHEQENKMKESDAYRRLMSCGVRPSVQRLAVMDYLLTHSTHPTIDDIYKDLQPSIPTLSRTTLYNTLRLFSETGAAQLLTIDDHHQCYDGNTEEHVHFLCKRCGKVIDCFDVAAPKRCDVGLVDGNKVEDVQLYYRGICARCLENEQKEDKQKMA